MLIYVPVCTIQGVWDAKAFRNTALGMGLRMFQVGQDWRTQSASSSEDYEDVNQFINCNKEMHTCMYKGSSESTV